MEFDEYSSGQNGACRGRRVAERVPCPTLQDVERVGHPSADVERIQTQLRVRTGVERAFGDQFGRVRADQADLASTGRLQQVNEFLQRLTVMTVRGPCQVAGVVIEDNHQIVVTAPIRDLIDADPSQPVEGIFVARASATTLPAIAPTVRTTPSSTRPLRSSRCAGRPDDLII